MITDTLQNEFWFHVSPQGAMPIAGEVPQFVDTEAISSLIDQFVDKENLELVDIKTAIQNDIQNIDLLRALIGISDKRMYLDLSYIFYKEKYNINDSTNILSQTLYNVNSHPLDFFKKKINDADEKLAEKALDLITNFLVDGGIIPVLNSLCKIGSAQAHILIDKLINAKEAQQKLTKRRGHGIEQVFAIFLNDLGVSYLPEDRHTNPMSRDPNVLRTNFNVSPKVNGKTWAFDLIVTKDTNTHIAYVQGLIHTSDPGQYGVNKSDETVLIKKEVVAFNEKEREDRELWGLVDGVGFTENKTNTIDKMLNEFDTFIQLRTLYKTALKLHQMGHLQISAISFNSDFYTNVEAQAMFDKYAATEIEFHYSTEPSSYTKKVNGGEATIYLN